MNIQTLKRVSACFTLLAVALLAGTVQRADAQALNVGYTDHEIILINMPEYQDVQEQLQSAFEGSQQELQTLYQDYQDKLSRYQQQQSLLSEDRRQEREQELMQLQQQLQEQQQQQQQQLAEQEGDLMQPLLQRVQTAINTVAEAQGLDVVLRSQVGTQPLLLYVNEETVQDITLLVAQEMGLDVDSTAAQEEPQPAGSN